MSVTSEEVERIAALARLELGQAEAESLRKDLNGILEHMETLGQAGSPGRSPAGDREDRREGREGADEGAAGSTAGIEAAHRSGPAPFREDGEAAPDGLARGPEELAPRWEGGFFAVPRLPGLDEEGTS